MRPRRNLPRRWGKRDCRKRPGFWYPFRCRSPRPERPEQKAAGFAIAKSWRCSGLAMALFATGERRKQDHSFGAPARSLLLEGHLDPLRPEALQDREIKIAAYRGGEADIGDDATQLEFERLLAETEQQNARRRLFYHLRVFIGGGEQNLAYFLGVGIEGDDDLHVGAAARIEMRPVLDDVGDELRIGDDDVGVLESFDLGRAHADAAHVAFLALHHDDVADADRPLGEKNDAGHEIRDDRL